MRVAKVIAETFENRRDGERLTISYTNWGEPYDQGVSLRLEGNANHTAVDLQIDEAERLHQFLGELLASIRETRKRPGSDRG